MRYRNQDTLLREHNPSQTTAEVVGARRLLLCRHGVQPDRVRLELQRRPATLGWRAGRRWLPSSIEPNCDRTRLLWITRHMEARPNARQHLSARSMSKRLSRHSDELQRRLAEINGRRDAGVHSLGEIWRRHRLSCPTREQLGSYLLGVLPADAKEYLAFHLETIECRFCQASIADLKAQQLAAEGELAERRRQKYFQSSAGYLRKK